MSRRIYTKTMWLAVDDRGRTQATWYRGCAQPFVKWRKVVKSMGWEPVRCAVRRLTYG